MSVKKPRIKYDLTLLTKICKDNDIELIGDYDNINCETKIKAKCIRKNCDNNMVEKSFRSFVAGEYYECAEHHKISVKLKIEPPPKKYTTELLLQICKDNNIELIGLYEDIGYQTTIRAKCIYEDCKNNMIEKSFRSFVEYKIYECEEHHKITVLDRKDSTCLSKYGNRDKNESVIFKTICFKLKTLNFNNIPVFIYIFYIFIPLEDNYIQY